MRAAILILAILSCAVAGLSPPLQAQPGGELRFAMRVEPKTFNPLQAADEGSELVRYLTGGVLIRLNRLTQELDPELASSWKVSEAGRRIDFQLRPNVQFSDGTPFTCEDVSFTLQQVMDPALHSPVGDSFRTGPGGTETKCASPLSGMARFPSPVAALAAQFDQVAILSAQSPKKQHASLGPFQVAEYRAGATMLLSRNPRYWKRDAQGRQLPYLASIRLDIQQNRETEILRFRRGQLDLINKLDPELFDQLAAKMPKAVLDAGPSLDWEILFFNQVPGAPIDDYKKAWFQSMAFRRAISDAINRDDLCRIVYRGHARSAVAPVSPSNRFWTNKAIAAPVYSTRNALLRLEGDGFHLTDGVLVDRTGHKVEFSMITNAGNKLHERMMSMIQQDLAKIGVRVNVLALDFPSLAERITRTFRYETCLAAMTNIGLDPNEVMNIWLSSGANHPWNPGQKKPGTAWEAEIDRLLIAQNRAGDAAQRKVSFDRVQEIIVEQAPVLFLLYPNALAAVSQRVKNLSPAPLYPQLYWNADRLALGPSLASAQ